MKDVVQWTAPAQMWRDAAGLEQPGARRTALQRPAILRFAKDTFMQDLLTLLENDPARLADHLAQPETWRDTVPTPAPVEVAPRFALPFQRARQALESKRQARLLAARGLSGRAKATNSAGQNVNALVSTKGVPSFARETLTTLKLYQPAHQRFYMVASCLVCGRAGLPDKALDKGHEETASFVVRRLFPATVVNKGARVPFVDPKTGAVDQTIPLPAFDETWEEYALVTTKNGETGWQKVVGGKNATADALVEGEEKSPLFPVNFTDDEGRRRRVLAGLVPVGKRETYAHASSLLQSQRAAEATNAAASATSSTGGGSSVSSSDPTQESLDPRLMKLWLDVTEPWKALLQKADNARAVEDPTWLPGHAIATPSKDVAFDDVNAKNAAIKSTRELLQTGSWYILLDFAKFLEENLPKVWAAIVSPSAVAALASDAPQLAVYNALNSAKLSGGRAATFHNESKLYQQTGKIKGNLVEALRAILLEDANPTAQARLEAAAVSYNRDAHAPNNSNAPDPTFPTFLFPLAHTEREVGDDSLGPLPVVTITPDAKDSEFDKSKKKIDALADLIRQAFERKTAPVASELPLAAQKPMDAREGYYRIRCVYERPLCGPIDPPVVSAPTREFQMAGFFDPDAPARPIRIALPIDTSPAGLRKFDKNTAFMMSDMLCGQIERMKGITLGDLVRTVLPWPLHKDLSVPDASCSQGGLEFGMICSLSIPIITICALIMLMIIVSLLDFIFKWMPFFIICFPLPGFAAKKK